MIDFIEHSYSFEDQVVCTFKMLSKIPEGCKQSLFRRAKGLIANKIKAFWKHPHVRQRISSVLQIKMLSNIKLILDKCDLGNTCYFIPRDDKFLLGLLNSSLFWFYFKNKLAVLGDPEKGGRLRFFTQFVVDIPIKKNKSEAIRKYPLSTHKNIKNPQQYIENLAAEMIDLHWRLSSTKAEADRLLLERQIKAVDKKINQLVYELYGLTNEEIKIIEEP